MAKSDLSFLTITRLARLEAMTKANRQHRGRRQAGTALRLATTRLLVAELRRERPRHAGRFTTVAPAGGPDLFGGI